MKEFYYVIYYLRKRILRFILLLIILIGIYFYVSDFIIEKINNELKPKEVKIIAISLLEYVVLKLKIALVLSLLTIIPILIYFSFKKLGFQLKLKHIPWIFIGIGLFSFGVIFTYKIILPAMIIILTNITLEANIFAYYTISSFVFFVFITIVIFGLMFELPLILSYLVINNYISIDTLIKRRRYVYVAIVILAALITADPTPVSQILLSIPLIVLYELSIALSKIYLKMKK